MSDAPIQSVDAVLNCEKLGHYRYMLYAAGALLMALEGYDAYVVANLATFIIKTFHSPISSMAFIFSIQNAGMAVGFYAIPMLADRYGRRWVILIGAALFGVLTLVSTVPTTLTGFAVVRFLTFIAFGGTMPNIVALVTEYLPENSRGRLLTWLFVAQGLGASAAGFIGPSFVHYHSWQAAFWFGGGLMLAAIPFLYAYLPESCRYLLVRKPNDPQIGRLLKRVDPNFVPLPGAYFVTAEERPNGWALPGLFRDGRTRMTVLLWIASAMILGASNTLTAWVPSFLHVLGGIDRALAARMTSVSAIGAIFGPVLLTLLMKRMPLPGALTVTTLLGFLAMTALSAVSSLPWLGWVLGFGMGFLVVGSIAGVNTLVAASYPTAMRSTGIGWAGGLGRITSIFGPGIAGLLLAAQWSPTAIYITIASPLVVAGIATAMLAAREKPIAAASRPTDKPPTDELAMTSNS